MNRNSLRRAVQAVHISTLEPRLLMSASPSACGCPACSGISIAPTDFSREFALEAAATSSASTADPSAGAKYALSSVPKLNSLPGAPKTIYLDFNGDAALRNTPAYDLDGDTSSFTDAELASMRKLWETVAEKFSPFNVNVTTVETAGAYRALIGGNAWSGPHSGYATGGIAYVFSGVKGQDAPVSWGTVAAHELGHVIGLSHQRVYNADGSLLYEYSFGTDKQAPIMGIGLGPRSMWSYGKSGPTTYQDDLAVLASRLGYRTDDHLAITALPSTAAFSLKGVIERMTDTDSFGFTTSGGALTVNVSLVDAGGMLNPALKILRSDGTILATADGAGNLLAAQLGETISINLPAGTYRIVVYGHGDYGDVGQYVLTGTVNGMVSPVSPTPLPSEVPPATPSVPPPVSPPAAVSGLVVTAVSSTQLGLRWTDVATENGYRIERSTDGVTFAALSTTGANVVSFSDSGLAASTRYVYRVIAYNGGGNAVATTAAGVTLAPPPVVAPLGTPSNLAVNYLGGHTVQLTWADAASSETGYEVWKSGDGVRWTLIKTLPTNTTEWVTANNNAYGQTYQWRVRAVNKYTRATSAFSGSVSLTLPTDGLLSTWEKLRRMQSA